MKERFDDKRRGQRLPAAEVNRLQDTVERAANLAAGGGVNLTQNSAFASLSLAAGAHILLVRLLCDVTYTEPTRQPDQYGDLLPAFYNAVMQSYDQTYRAWADVEGAEIEVANPYNLSYDKGAVVAVFKMAGRWVLLPRSAIRIGVTVKDYTNDDDLGEPGYYPSQEEEPNTYCVTLADASYSPCPGNQTFDPQYKQPPGPHLVVLNLYSGPGAYLAEGTVVWCFEAGGRYFTFMLAVVEEQYQDLSLVENVCVEYEEINLDLAGADLRGVLPAQKGGTGLDMTTQVGGLLQQVAPGGPLGVGPVDLANNLLVAGVLDEAKGGTGFDAALTGPGLLMQPLGGGPLSVTGLPLADPAMTSGVLPAARGGLGFDASTATAGMVVQGTGTGLALAAAPPAVPPLATMFKWGLD